jgi:hypothetical protein
MQLSWRESFSTGVTPFALIFLNAVYLSGGSYVIVTKKKCHGLQRQTSTLFKWLKKKALDFIHGNTQQSTVE